MNLGELPPPTLENFDEWNSKAPPIIQTAQWEALAFQSQTPSIARIFNEVCAPSLDRLGLINPITGIAGCYACAATSHATAALPSNVMIKFRDEGNGVSNLR